MALFQIGPAMKSYEWLPGEYADTALTLGTRKGSEAIFRHAGSLQIVFTGHDLTYGSRQLTGGTVEKAVFLNDAGKTLLTVSDGQFSASALSADLGANTNLWNLLSQLSAGDDKITGGLRFDNLNLGDNGGDDTIKPGAGGALVSGSEGNDRLYGSKGDGWDVLSYEETHWRGVGLHGVTVNVAAKTVIDGWGDTDKISNFEEIRGTIYSDKISGGVADEVFMGLGGADVIDGRGGRDEIHYYLDERYGGDQGIVADLGAGTVRDGFGDVDAVSHIEDVYGTELNDVFVGDDNRNYFRGIGGKDRFDGGGGIDTVAFSWWEDLGQHGVTINMARTKNQVIDDGFGNTESLSNIEVVEGSNFDDRITLGASAFVVWGGKGNDRLVAGTGVQSFYGGEGQDRFVFRSVETLSTHARSRDVINDFSHAEGDKIDLRELGDLVFKGEGSFHGAEGELRYKDLGDDLLVRGDIDGDKVADFTLIVADVKALGASDFAL